MDVIVEKPTPLQVRYNLWFLTGYVEHDTIAYWSLVGDGTNYGSRSIRGLATVGWFFHGVDSIKAGAAPIAIGHGRIGRFPFGQVILDSIYTDLQPGQYFNHRTDFSPFIIHPGDDWYYQFALVIGDSIINESRQTIRLAAIAR